MSELLTSVDQVMPLINKIKKESFPKLLNTKISLGSVKSDSVFLESRPVLYSLLWPFKVKYKITVNPKLYKMELPLFALEGILAHELAHTADYVTKGRLGVILTGHIFISKSAHIDFERKTDVDAIMRGYGEGIKAYRKIIYKYLTDEQINVKKQRYFSIEEIDQLMLAYQEYPELKEVWLDNPPLSLAAIQRDVDSSIARRNSEDGVSNIS